MRLAKYGSYKNMCGIAGILSPNTVEKEQIIADMVAKIRHRGPDDDGFFVDGNIGLGMRRLSIIDLSTGKQPIWSADGKKLIFFNGEIYNYKELREELVAKGCVFKTRSDTEVILHMFSTHGPTMLTRLRGMFTFAIYNTETAELFIARDFFGIKPLYYLVEDGPGSRAELTTGRTKIKAFSYEIKSFLGIPSFKPEVNNDAVKNYLSFQYNPLPETFFKNVYKLLPAHYMRVNLQSGEVEIKRYWSFKFEQNNNLDEVVTSKTVFGTIENSVQHHMIADVPVGSFLSGGVDSSIIATLMQKIRGEKRIKTFTVGFDTLTEGLESKETADFLGTDHTEITIGPDEYFKALPDAVYHFDEPVGDPSAIGLYFLAREARKHVKVVLSGEGADELFGGYNIYLAPFSSEKLKWLPKSVIRLFLKIPFEYFGKNYLRRVNMKLEDWYFGQKYFNESIFQRSEIQKVWTRNSEKFFSLGSLYKNIENLSESTQMQYIDINTWLIGDILAKADKMTMAHSLELRVPFLDTVVASLAKILPDRFKWRGGVTKYLLRQAFKSVVPETTRNRKKLGFPVPIKDWFTKDREGLYRTIINNRYIKKHMDVGYIQNLIDEHTMKK